MPVESIQKKGKNLDIKSRKELGERIFKKQNLSASAFYYAWQYCSFF